jgi:ferredoxin
MANSRKRVPENVGGDFFVDPTCLDCDACRQIAPTVFGEAAETSFVKAQPGSSTDRRQAFQALPACPTGSIGCLGDDDVKAVMKDFPLSSRSRPPGIAPTAPLKRRFRGRTSAFPLLRSRPAPRTRLVESRRVSRHASAPTSGFA